MNLLEKFLELKKDEALSRCPYDYDELNKYLSLEFSEMCHSGSCGTCWKMEVGE